MYTTKYYIFQDGYYINKIDYMVGLRVTGDKLSVINDNLQAGIVCLLAAFNLTLSTNWSDHFN